VLTLLHLLSAVALLVWGTHIVRTGVMRVFGARLRTVLSRSVEKKPLAFCAGIGVTALVQSSNATTMLVTSFVAQDLVALTPALVIVLGADVGTALMARILTFDLSWLSPLLIFIGVTFFLGRKQTREGQLGRVGIGLGDDPGQRRTGYLCLADRRYSFGCTDWCRIRDNQLLQPGGGAVNRHADHHGRYLVPGRAVSGDWR